MKKILSTLVVMGLFGLAVSAQAATDEKVGIVDLDAVVQKHPSKTELTTALEKKFKEPQEKLKKQQEAIAAEIKKLETDAPNLRRADIKNREDAINKKRETFLADARKYEENSAKIAHETETKLLSDIQRAVHEVAKEQSYTLIIEKKATLFVADSKDITAEVIKKLKPIK